MPKKRYKFIITIIVISFLSLIHHVASDEAAIMARLAQSFRPTPSGWSGTNYCKWQGVSCESNKVTSINLSSRSLSGTVPPEIVQLSNLQSLNLQRNQLSGPIPPLSNHASLEDISLDYNNFNSTPTNFLSGLPSLQTFSMNNNTFLAPWSIPDGLRNSSSLTSFYVTWSNIVGEIPDFFDDLPNLQSLRLSYNSMTGSLPRSLAKSSIQNLWLNNVGFSGQLDVLGAMTQLRVAWVHVNSFTGPIPDLSACTDLTEIQFRDNDLTGVIPVSLTRLPKLLNLSLQNNKFQGPMPSFPKGLQVSLGNTNKFCTTNPGPCDPQVTILLEAVSAFGYPSTLADSWEGNDPCGNSWRFIVCERGSVTKVNFGRQNWSGTISPTFANLTSLKALYLNDNRLYGTIPTSLTSLRQLELIDISNNNISGRIPPFAGSVTVRTSGNQFIGQDVPIFNPDNSSSRNNGVNVPSGPNNVRRRSTISPWIIVVPVIVVIVILAIVGFVVYQRYYLKKKGKKKWFGKETEAGNKKEKKTLTKLNTESPIMSSSAIGTPLSSGERSDYHVYDGGNVTIPIEVLREVTDNFSENNILGKGGFGIVYKGQLHDGTRIAVKRMESSVVKDKGMNEFKAEIEVLTKVRHRHLVALHGFCENGNERLLVYEYMPQGCLGRHLFEWQEKEIAPLTWNQRMIIALDVARGVEYLHSLAQTSFIHRDLKPSNILLGDDMRAKVSDFGLVKSAPDGKYSLETRLAGTFGYLAPEYAATGRVTTKVDVFAFGVVLMEIITGRKALDDSLPEDKSHLVTWFRRLLNDKNEIKTALDPIIIPSATADEEAFQSIWKVAELAGHCTARESYQRPDMSHAVNVLSPLVEQWTPAPDEDDSLGIDLDMGLPQVLQKWKASEEESTMTSGFFSSGTSANKPNSEFTSSSESNSGR